MTELKKRKPGRPKADTPGGELKKRPPGRPKKTDLPSKEKRPVGRPPGTAAIMNEYKDRMLRSPKSREVLDSIFAAALDDTHKNQAAAWKLLMDRMMPVSMFEQEVTKGGGRPSININITGIGDSVTIDGGDGNESDGEIIDGEVDNGI